MRTIEVTLYKIDELSEVAKEKAFQDWIGDGDTYHWHKENRESLISFIKLFPITVNDWSYGDRNSGVSFRFDNDYHYDIDAVENLSGIRLATWLWNNLKNDIYKGRWYSHSFNRKTNTLSVKPGDKRKDRRSKLFLETGGVLTGYTIDDSLLTPIYEFLKKPDKSVTFNDLLTDCFHEWVKDCESDVEHSSSMEAFLESAQANEYEYDDYGNMQ